MVGSDRGPRPPGQRFRKGTVRSGGGSRCTVTRPIAHHVGAVLRWLRYLLIALLGLGLVLLILWAVVVVPPRLIDTSQIPDPAKRLDEVNGLRTNLLGVLAGMAVVAGAVVGALNFRETSRQNRAVLELQRRGQVTERFTRAIEQLGQHGDDRLDVRIGAVYALEQIARDSEELHWPIIEVLTAYLREHAPAAARTLPDALRKQPPADHQAIATVIGRRRCERDPAGQPLDLHGTTLPGVKWREAHLKGANLVDVHLEGADLRDAHLERAILHGASLNGTHLFRADMRHAGLVSASLDGAVLSEASLEGANLTGANLEGADFRDAHLDGATLRDAHLEKADLRAAIGLTVGQLQVADKPGLARLPAKLRLQLAGPKPAGEGQAGEGAPEAGPGQD